MQGLRQSGYAARAYLGAAPSGPSAGTYILNLPVPFHRQLTAVWCDPAIIQNWYEYASGRTVADSRAFQAVTWEWEASHQPAIALIWRGEHYVLVRGVEGEGDPYRDYPTATIRGVYVLDPNQGSGAWLGSNLYIPLGEWTSRYLTPVSHLTPHTGVPGDQWQGKRVTIQADWRAGPPLEQGRTPADLAAYLAAGEP